MKATYLTICCFFVSWTLLSQTPNWSVTPSDFTYTMSLVVAVSNECTEVDAMNYRVGVFDKNGQCRGFSDLFTTNAGYRGFPTVYSNVINEELYYRIYDADENEVFWSYLTRLEFLAEAIQGSVSEPIRVFYDSEPAVDADPDQTVSGTSTTLAATGTDGVWLIVYGEGGSFDDQSSPTAQFSGQSGETYQLVWTVTDGVCLNEMDHVIITFVEVNCVVSFTFNNTLTESGASIYNASTTITSQADIESGANIQYLAGQSITLRPGFHAKSGSQFRAAIVACSNSNESAIEARTMPDTQNYLTIFPNPTSDQFQIQLTHDLTTTHQLSLFDGQGKLIRQWDNGLNSNIVVADLAPGLYWLLLRSEEIEEQHKIVVMR